MASAIKRMSALSTASGSTTLPGGAVFNTAARPPLRTADSGMETAVRTDFSAT